MQVVFVLDEIFLYRDKSGIYKFRYHTLNEM